MTDSDNRQIAPGPSSNSLFKSAFFTLLGAVLATVLFIMPAEYGVDPTGLGTKLGLTDLEQTAPDPVPAHFLRRQLRTILTSLIQRL